MFHKVSKYLHNYSKKINQPPGHAIFTGEKKSENVSIKLIEYNSESIVEKEIDNENELINDDSKTVKWINVNGLHDISIIENLCLNFSIHPLIIEDIAHLSQQPKIEVHEDYIYFVMRMIYIKDNKLVNEQFSLVLGSNFVLTFQEIKGDVFNALRERLRSLKFKITKSHADYLAYSLIDIIIDNYFEILEFFGEEIDKLEEGLFISTSNDLLNNIHSMRKELTMLKKTIWPVREMVSGFEKTESHLVKKSTKIYIRDIYDHTIHIIEHIDNYREVASGIRDTYLTNLSNKMNEIMKTLTIISTIFIPLTFIAGIYGMNFENIPELKWHFGYFCLWGLNIFITIGLIFYFKKRKWL